MGVIPIRGSNTFYKLLFTMKKLIKTIIGIVCVTSLILAGGETPDGSCDLVWSLSFLALSGLSGYGYKKMEEAK